MAQATYTNGKSQRRQFDVEAVRQRVHGLEQTMAGHRLVYLDSAATSQRAVESVDAITDLLRNHNANIHQEGFELARRAKKMYDGARSVVAKFIGAVDPS